MTTDTQIELYEDNSGGLWLVVGDRAITGLDPDNTGFRADARSFGDSWDAEDVTDEHNYQREDVAEILDDVSTRHLATYDRLKDRLTLHRAEHEMGHAGRAYLRLSLADAEALEH